MRFFLSFLFLTIVFASCVTDNLKSSDDPLPILGFKDTDTNGNTIYHTVPDFSFIDQDSNEITNNTFKGKAYIADFFFIHCPSICPKVKAQMMRIYEAYEDKDDLYLLSHTLDTKNDTIPALKAYADKLEVDSKKWHFVTGDHDLIYSIADDYFVAALVNEDAPGGFDHSGRIILVDEKRHIRAFAEGTDPKSVDKFLIDIEKLLNEKN